MLISKEEKPVVCEQRSEVPKKEAGARRSLAKYVGCRLVDL